MLVLTCLHNAEHRILRLGGVEVNGLWRRWQLPCRRPLPPRGRLRASPSQDRFPRSIAGARKGCRACSTAEFSRYELQNVKSSSLPHSYVVFSTVVHFPNPSNCSTADSAKAVEQKNAFIGLFTTSSEQISFFRAQAI